MDFPILLITIIGLALIFDYINGFHDAANSIATIVSTKVLTPFQAVIWAALWNFAAFFLAVFVFGGFKIGNTIAKIVNENFITLEVIFSGLVAAIAWNLLTWWLGIPSSSSHTLIGGFLGAALTHAFIGNYNEIRAIQEVSSLEALKLSIEKIFTQDVIAYGKVISIFLFIFFLGVIYSLVSNFMKSYILLFLLSSLGFFGIFSILSIILRYLHHTLLNSIGVKDYIFRKIEKNRE